MPYNPPSRTSPSLPEARPSSPILITLAWALVLIPTAWGLTFTFQNALKLFHSPTTTTQPTK